MFRRTASYLLVPTIRNSIQRRCQSVIAGPPTQRVTTADKIFLGGGMVVSILLYPAWVVYHIREYKSGK